MKLEQRWYCERADGTRYTIYRTEIRYLHRMNPPAVAVVTETWSVPEPADVEAWNARLRAAVGRWLAADAAWRALGYTARTDEGDAAGCELIDAEEAVRAAYAGPCPSERVVESTREAIAQRDGG
jgi:hypothetical protein